MSQRTMYEVWRRNGKWCVVDTEKKKVLSRHEKSHEAAQEAIRVAKEHYAENVARDEARNIH